MTDSLSQRSYSDEVHEAALALCDEIDWVDGPVFVPNPATVARLREALGLATNSPVHLRPCPCPGCSRWAAMRRGVPCVSMETFLCRRCEGTGLTHMGAYTYDGGRLYSDPPCKDCSGGDA